MEGSYSFRGARKLGSQYRISDLMIGIYKVLILRLLLISYLVQEEKICILFPSSKTKRLSQKTGPCGY